MLINKATFCTFGLKIHMRRGKIDSLKILTKKRKKKEGSGGGGEEREKKEKRGDVDDARDAGKDN